MYRGKNLKKIGAFEAKNRLSELLDAAENGEEVIITKHGRPVAKLVPIEPFDRDKARAAAEWLNDFRKRHPLRGVKIKDLINEGRKTVDASLEELTREGRSLESLFARETGSEAQAAAGGAQ